MRRQGARREGESGSDGHHLGMHAQRSIGVMTTAHGLERSESTFILLITLLRLTTRLRLSFQTLLEFGNSRAIDGGAGQATSLQSTAVEAGLVAIEALTDDLTTTNDDSAVAVVKGGKVGLGQAEIKVDVVTWRHFSIFDQVTEQGSKSCVLSVNLR